MARNLRLVTDFSSLSLGDHVLVMFCDHCSHSHEGRLARFVPNGRGAIPGSKTKSVIETAWVMDILCDGLAPGVTASLVEANRVFLVVEADEQTATAEKSNSRPLERVR